MVECKLRNRQEVVDRVASLRREGLTIREIARRVGVSSATVGKMVEPTRPSGAFECHPLRQNAKRFKPAAVFVVSYRDLGTGESHIVDSFLNASAAKYLVDLLNKHTPGKEWSSNKVLVNSADFK